MDPKLVPAEIPKPDNAPTEAPTLARALSLFDITMLVMGSVIGAGIFVVPHDVAKVVHTPALVLIAWVLGGVVSLAGSLVYADLVRRRPHVGGQYAFLREAYHPVVAFLYGWCLLWVIQSGGMASVAVVFARYFMELGNLFPAILSGSPSEAPGTAGDTLVGKVIAAVTIACLTAVNCLGVRTASTAQNLFMMFKVLAIGALIACGLLVALPSGGQSGGQVAETAGAWWMVPALAAALVPVLFAYGGWHTTTFMAAEVRDARRTLPRGLLLGVAGVTLLYLGVNYVCLRVLGVEELAANGSPAYEVMRRALGGRGAALLSAGIAVSALGFLSQAVLTSPRVYFAMARDGLFFQAVARIHPRTRVPVVAILLQGAFASVIAVSGTFHQIPTMSCWSNWCSRPDRPEPVHFPAQRRTRRRRRPRHSAKRHSAGSSGDHVTIRGGNARRGRRHRLRVSGEQRDRTRDRRGRGSGIRLLAVVEPRREEHGGA